MVRRPKPLVAPQGGEGDRVLIPLPRFVDGTHSAGYLYFIWENPACCGVGVALRFPPPIIVEVPTEANRLHGRIRRCGESDLHKITAHAHLVLYKGSDSYGIRFCGRRQNRQRCNASRSKEKFEFSHY